MSCSCPLCPLESKNVQLCNVYLTYFPRRGKVYVKNCDDLSIHRHLIDLVNIHRGQLKIDEPQSWEQKYSDYTLEQIAENRYKVCFHSKKPIVEDLN